MAAEYVMSEGNYKVILCERGVRTFADHTRNTLDLSIVPAVQRLSHLPIVVDPSHGTGKRNKVTPLSRAAIAVGADGLIVEVHHEPDRAMSDGIAVALSRAVRRTDEAGAADCARGGKNGAGDRHACPVPEALSVRPGVAIFCQSISLKTILLLVVILPVVAAAGMVVFPGAPASRLRPRLS